MDVEHSLLLSRGIHEVRLLRCAKHAAMRWIVTVMWLASAFALLSERHAWAGTLFEQQELVAGDGAANDQFGKVAMSGNTAIVGAPGNDSTRGAAYVWVQSGTSWASQQKLVASDGSDHYFFGGSV